MREYIARTEILQTGRMIKIALLVEDRPVSYAEFIDALRSDAEFRRWFSRCLADVPFASFRWETPALSQGTLNNPFEFVLIDAPLLDNRAVDAQTFAQYFRTDEPMVLIKSLGGDATLIVPIPLSEHDHYNHLASFLRDAPEHQVDAMWQSVANVIKKCKQNQLLWLNTEGSGVAWLHVRIDTHPKYYSYTPYKQVQ